MVDIARLQDVKGYLMMNSERSRLYILGRTKILLRWRSQSGERPWFVLNLMQLFLKCPSRERDRTFVARPEIATIFNVLTHRLVELER